MHDCDSSGKCSYYISWKDAGENVDMTITCKQTNNRYCAVGFSRDTKMVSTYVRCLYDIAEDMFKSTVFTLDIGIT